LKIFFNELSTQYTKSYQAIIIIIISWSLTSLFSTNSYQTRMWANAQRDSRPAEYRWRPLFNLMPQFG